MWSRLYRNHVLMAFPTYDSAKSAWVPQVDINWFLGAAHDSKFVRYPNRFMTEDEAVNWALARGQAWIDNHLRRLQGGPSKRRRMFDPSTRAPALAGDSRSGFRPTGVLKGATDLPVGLHMIGTFKRSPGKTSANEPRPAHAAQPRRGKQSFTFEEFASLLAQKGLRFSAETLQKSYAALVKVKKIKRWSWAETKRKVMRAQHAPATSGTPQRIPLSGSAWGKIV